MARDHRSSDKLCPETFLRHYARSFHWKMLTSGAYLSRSSTHTYTHSWTSSVGSNTLAGDIERLATSNANDQLGSTKQVGRIVSFPLLPSIVRLRMLLVTGPSESDRVCRLLPMRRPPLSHGRVKPDSVHFQRVGRRRRCCKSDVS